MDDETVLQSAIEKFQAGDLQQAASICGEILDDQPDNASVLHFLGVIYYYLGKYEASIEYLERALRNNPEDATIHYDLGNALREAGRSDEAVLSYQNAVQLNPQYLDAYNDLGLVFHERQQFDDAIAYYQQALGVDPNNPDVYYNLGNVLQDRGEFDEALRNYQKATSIDPNLDYAWNNIGNIFLRQKQLDEAASYYEKALGLNPELAEAYNNLGYIFYKKGRYDAAADAYRRAIELEPGYAYTHYNFGNVLREQGNTDAALASYRRALEINPGYAEAYLQIGLVLDNEGNSEEAIAAYDSAIEIDPGLFAARYARCMSRLVPVYQDEQSIEASRKKYHDELVELQEDLSLDTLEETEKAAGVVGSLRPFYLAYLGGNDRELKRLYGEVVCAIMAAMYPAYAEDLPMPPYGQGAPLRIGIVSGFFCDHPVWRTHMRGWIEQIDKQRFSLFGYHTGAKHDKVTAGAKMHFSHFVDGVPSFNELCKRILEDDLHVLLYPEIGIDPTVLRLASLRLAPVQCASWGYPETSGLPTIDCFLSSDLMEPVGADEQYTERLIRLPNLSMYYSPANVSRKKRSRDKFGLRPQAVLYHCLQPVYEYLPQYDEIFPRIVRQAGDCQFLFALDPDVPMIIEQFRLRLKKVFERFDLDSDEYVAFLPVPDSAEYRTLTRLCDVFLDPVGWSAGTSVLEAIACNLPIVTLPTDLMRGREAFALLTRMGVTETIARNPDEYISLASRLGTDEEWRRDVSGKMAARKRRIYRDKTCITAMEEFLEKAVNPIVDDLT